MNTLKATLYTLLAARAGGETLIEADQNAPRPPLPYWTWRILAMPGLGSDEYSQGVTDDGDQTVSGVREMTIALQRYGADSEVPVSSVREDLARMTVVEQWQKAYIALIRCGSVVNTSTTLDNAEIEPRYLVEIYARFATTLLDRVGIIETIEADGTYPGTASEDEVQHIVINL
jgi:hypothetical protein